MKYVLEIARFDPSVDSEPRFAHYTVEAEPTDRILDGLMYVKDRLDPSLGFRRSCAHGVCGSDAMLINGRERLACKTLVKDVVPGGAAGANDADRVGGAAGANAADRVGGAAMGTDAGGVGEPLPVVTVAPLRTMRVLRDLIVDQTDFFASFRSVKPFLINDQPASEKERLQSPDERARFDDQTNCILCASCRSACPVVQKTMPDFIGPAALVQAGRFLFDSRDKGLSQRLDPLDLPRGAWACENHFECTRVCPRGIKVTKNINEIKRTLSKYKEAKA